MLIPKPTLVGIAVLVLLATCNLDATRSSADFQAPAFALPGLDDGTISLDDVRGQVVVVHFGASSCPSCRAGALHLEALYREYKDRGVQALVIDVGEPDTTAARWKKEAGFSFPVLLDRDGAVAARYAPPEAQPDRPRHEAMVAATLIIDRTGTVRFMSLLDTGTVDAELVALRTRLEEILAEEPSPASRTRAQSPYVYARHTTGG